MCFYQIIMTSFHKKSIDNETFYQYCFIIHKPLHTSKMLTTYFHEFQILMIKTRQIVKDQLFANLYFDQVFKVYILLY